MELPSERDEYVFDVYSVVVLYEDDPVVVIVYEVVFETGASVNVSVNKGTEESSETLKDDGLSAELENTAR